MIFHDTPACVRSSALYAALRSNVLPFYLKDKSGFEPDVPDSCRQGAEALLQNTVVRRIRLELKRTVSKLSADAMAQMSGTEQTICWLWI
jgi:hypothetical protein